MGRPQRYELNDSRTLSIAIRYVIFSVMLSRLYINEDLSYLYTLEEEEYEFPADAIGL